MYTRGRGVFARQYSSLGQIQFSIESRWFFAGEGTYAPASISRHVKIYTSHSANRLGGRGAISGTNRCFAFALHTTDAASERARGNHAPTRRQARKCRASGRTESFYLNINARRGANLRPGMLNFGSFKTRPRVWQIFTER